MVRPELKYIFRLPTFPYPKEIILKREPGQEGRKRTCLKRNPWSECVRRAWQLDKPSLLLPSLLTAILFACIIFLGLLALLWADLDCEEMTHGPGDARQSLVGWVR